MGARGSGGGVGGGGGCPLSADSTYGGCACMLTFITRGRGGGTPMIMVCDTLA